VPRPDAIPRYWFGGVGISCVDMDSALQAMLDLVAARAGGYWAFTCAHGIVASQSDARLREILNGSRMTLPDGMPTVWVGRFKGMPVRRVTAPDFLESVMRHPAGRKLRHYFYGGSPEAIARVAERAQRMLGAGALAGWLSPPLRPAGALEEGAVIEAIAAARPDVLWVGLGLPKQEYWMANHQGSLPGTLMLGVGAAFDWFAGLQPRAPQLLQNAGLEWLHRVVMEPKRLWPRYRAVVPSALRLLTSELLHGARSAP
jgi:N-acetylglucosaminyldiphosphoundecaprenol N-acetyl-beta-D-mannosaminyltransferase